MRVRGDTSQVSSGRLPIFVASQGGRRTAVTWVARGVGSVAALFAFAMVASILGVPGVRGVSLPFASHPSADSSPPPVVLPLLPEPTTSTAPAAIAPATPSYATVVVVDADVIDQPLVGDESTVVADPPADDPTLSVAQGAAPNASSASANQVARLASPSPSTAATPTPTNPPRAATTASTTVPSSVGPKATAPGQVAKSAKTVSPSVTAPGHA